MKNSERALKFQFYFTLTHTYMAESAWGSHAIPVEVFSFIEVNTEAS